MGGEEDRLLHSRGFHSLFIFGSLANKVGGVTKQGRKNCRYVLTAPHFGHESIQKVVRVVLLTTDVLM